MGKIAAKHLLRQIQTKWLVRILWERIFRRHVLHIILFITHRSTNRSKYRVKKQLIFQFKTSWYYGMSCNVVLEHSLTNNGLAFCCHGRNLLLLFFSHFSSFLYSSFLYSTLLFFMVSVHNFFFIFSMLSTRQNQYRMVEKEYRLLCLCVCHCGSGSWLDWCDAIKHNIT